MAKEEVRVGGGGQKRARSSDVAEDSPEAKRSKVELPTVPEEQAVESREEKEEEVVPANSIAQPTPMTVITSIQQRPNDVDVTRPQSRPQPQQQRRQQTPVLSALQTQLSSPQASFVTPTIAPSPSQPTQPRSATPASIQAPPPGRPLSSQSIQPPARPPSVQRNQAYGSAIPAHLQQQQQVSHTPPSNPNPVQSQSQNQQPNVNSAFASLTPQQQNYIRQQQHQAMMAQQQAQQHQLQQAMLAQQREHQQAMSANGGSNAGSPRIAPLTNPPPSSQQSQIRPPSAMSHSSPYNAPSPAHSHAPSPAASQSQIPIAQPSQPSNSADQRPLADQYAGIQSIISAPTFRQLPPPLQQNLQQQAQTLLYQMQAATMAMARNGGGPPSQPPNRMMSPALTNNSIAPSPRPRVPSYSQSPQVQHAQVPPSRMSSVGPVQGGGGGPQSQYAGSYAGSMAGSPPGTGQSQQQRPTSAMSGHAPDSAALFREQ